MALFWVIIGIYYLCNICHCGRFYDAWPFDPNNPDKIYGSNTVRQGWTPNWNKKYTSLYEWINEPPSITLRGKPLQSRGDLIKVEMKWDVNTGEPAKNYEHEQSKDGAPVPPYGCIKIIWYKDDDDYTLNCMGGDFIMKGLSSPGVIPFSRPKDVDVLKSSYKDSDTGDTPEFCCSANIQPYLESNGDWTFDWYLPHLTIYADGTFAIFMSNTDILNDKGNEWVSSNQFSIIREQITSNPTITLPAGETFSPTLRPRVSDDGVFAVSTLCPYDAQVNPPENAEECPDWEIDDEGAKVVWISNEPYSNAKQFNTFFHPDTTSIFLANSKMSNIVAGLFDNCEKLRILELSNNLFKEMPSFGIPSSTITELDMSYNLLESINPVSLRSMIVLSTLSINNNRITELESNIFQMTRLTQLDISNNSLQQLPLGLFTDDDYPNSMIHMEGLNLKFNSIKTLGDEDFFKYAINLEELDLEGNRLQDLSPFLHEYDGIKINIEGENEPLEGRPLSKLKRLYLDFVEADGINDSLFNDTQLTNLTIRVNTQIASQLTFKLFEPIGETLQELILWTEDAFRIPNNFLHPCQIIEKIVWKDSGLLSLGDRFNNLGNLRILDLSNNQIHSVLGDAWVGSESIEEIDLSNNDIEQIYATSFHGLTNLKILKIRNNQIQHFDKDAMYAIHDPSNETDPKILEELDITSNPLVCVPIWMEGPDTDWYSTIERYEQLYGPPPGLCTLCQIGFYAAKFENAGDDCEPCPQGGVCPYNYDEEYGTYPWTIEWCDPGTFVETGEGRSLTDCTPCPAGHYCPGEGLIYECTEPLEACEGGCVDECYICPGGTVAAHDHSACHACPLGWWGNDGISCYPCPAGTFGGSEGLNTSECSGLCDEGHYCLEGSTSSKEFECPNGTYGETKGLMTKECTGLCEIGTYCPPGSISKDGIPCKEGRYGSRPGEENELCTGPCSVLHYCPKGSVSPFNLKCTEGKTSRPGDDGCYQCPVGMYNTDQTPLCADCLGNHTWISSYVTSLSGVLGCEPCPLGTYNYTINPYSIAELTECRDCPPGTYNDLLWSFSEDDCKPCPIHTYGDESGLTSKYECTPCPIGTFSIITGATSNDTCEYCGPGTYFLNDNNQESIRDPDTVCQNCPTGSYSNGTGKCYLCSIGYWSNIIGRTIPCNQICNENYLCPPGSNNPRMFLLYQGNTLPILTDWFWIPIIFSWNIGIIILLWKYG